MSHADTEYSASTSALLSTLVISLAPHVLLFVIPIFKTVNGKKVVNQKLLKVLVSFAVGGLLGDAFLHLIPHAFDPHDHAVAHSHDHSHEHHDAAARHLLQHDAHAHSHAHAHTHEHEHGHHHDHASQAHHGHEHGHDHSHSHSHHDHDHHSHGHGHDHSHGHGHDHDHTKGLKVGLLVLSGMLTFFIIQKYVMYRSGGHGHSHFGDAGSHAHGGSDEGEDEHARRQELIAGSGGLRRRKQRARVRPKRSLSEAEAAAKRVGGILNLIADFAHNFTDGMALAASFMAGNSVGYSTAIAVLFHEIPHEVGDYAILLQSGFSRWNAMLMQFVTALGAFAGCAFGLFFGGQGQAAANWILPFTAGGFIYIATVDIIPDLLKDPSPKQTFVEIVAMLIGVGFMVIIALYE